MDMFSHASEKQTQQKVAGMSVFLKGGHARRKHEKIGVVTIQAGRFW